MKPKRSKKYVDRKVQGTLAKRVAMHWFAFLSLGFLSGILLQIFAHPFRTLGEHVNAIWMTQGPFFVVMALLMPLVVWDTVKLSHRFAGPILSLRNAMRNAAPGSGADTLKFRDDDFWQDLAHDFNELVRRFEREPRHVPAASPAVATAPEPTAVGSGASS